MRQSLFLLFLCLSFSVQATIIYVNPTATGNNDGTNWTDAYTNLQTAFNNITPGANDSIFIAEGTYKPTGTGTADCIEITEGCSIYGGFPATGNPTLNDRDWNTYMTYFDGDLNGDDVQHDLSQNKSDNAARILCAYATSERITIDGVVFKNGGSTAGGNATGIASSAFLHIYNCRFEDIISAGFGVIRLASSAGSSDSSYFYNTHFYYNSAGSTGTALLTAQHNGKVIFENSTFNYTIGAREEFHVTNPSLVKFNNCVFANRVDASGNSVNSLHSLTSNSFTTVVEINHCTYYNVDQPFFVWPTREANYTIANTFFDFNDGQSGFLFQNGNTASGSANAIDITFNSVACSSDSIINTMDNTTVNGSLSTGTFTYATKDTVNNIFQLDCSSPFVNSGVVIAGITEDIEGNNRNQGGQPDLGAYETSCISSSTTPNKVEQSTLVLFPNPVHDLLNIQTTAQRFNQIEIIDMSGRSQRLNITATTQHQLQVNTYPAGLYVLRLYKDGKVIAHQKFVKSNR